MPHSGRREQGTVKGFPWTRAVWTRDFHGQLPGTDEGPASSYFSKGGPGGLLVFHHTSKTLELVSLLSLSNLLSASVPAIQHPHPEPLRGRVGLGGVGRSRVVLGQSQTCICLLNLLLAVPWPQTPPCPQALCLSRQFQDHFKALKNGVYNSSVSRSLIYSVEVLYSSQGKSKEKCHVKLSQAILDEACSKRKND